MCFFGLGAGEACLQSGRACKNNCRHMRRRNPSLQPRTRRATIPHGKPSGNGSGAQDFGLPKWWSPAAAAKPPICAAKQQVPTASCVRAARNRRLRPRVEMRVSCLEHDVQLCRTANLLATDRALKISGCRSDGRRPPLTRHQPAPRSNKLQPHRVYGPHEIGGFAPKWQRTLPLGDKHWHGNGSMHEEGNAMPHAMLPKEVTRRRPSGGRTTP
jgi:hypothetical protein